jgi:biotin operon repressor
MNKRTARELLGSQEKIASTTELARVLGVTRKTIYAEPEEMRQAWGDQIVGYYCRTNMDALKSKTDELWGAIE